MKTSVKNLLERIAPSVVAALRHVREVRALKTSVFRETPHGFLIAGYGEQAAADYELDEIAAIRSALQRCDVFVDVGANIGFYSCLACSLGRRVVAIEPLEQNLEYLYSNLLENGWSDVEVFPLGVSHTPMITRLYGGRGTASTIQSWAGASHRWHRTIACSTLDIIRGERFAGKRLVVKIDVEGSEYDVLRGATTTLSMEPAPTWLVEVCLTENYPNGINSRFRDVFALFWSQGYNATSVGAGEPRRVTPADVERWVSSGSRDFGYVSYLFTKPDLGA